MTNTSRDTDYSFAEYFEYCAWHLDAKISAIPFNTERSDFSHGAHMTTIFKDMKFAIQVFLPKGDERFNQEPFNEEFYSYLSSELSDQVYGPDDDPMEYNPINREHEIFLDTSVHARTSQAFEQHCETMYQKLLTSGLINTCESAYDLPLSNPRLSFPKSHPRPFTWAPKPSVLQQ